MQRRKAAQAISRSRIAALNIFFGVVLARRAKGTLRCRPKTRKARATFADLPVELLEAIHDYALDPPVSPHQDNCTGWLEKHGGHVLRTETQHQALLAFVRHLRLFATIFPRRNYESECQHTRSRHCCFVDLQQLQAGYTSAFLSTWDPTPARCRNPYCTPLMAWRFIDTYFETVFITRDKDVSLLR